MADFAVKFNSMGGSFPVKMQVDSKFAARFGDFVEVTDNTLDYYEGSYEITPQITAQTLQTAQKTMQEDLTVKEIPYAEVSNIFGGKTVTIGG